MRRAAHPRVFSICKRDHFTFSPRLFASHVTDGPAFFRLVCEQDLEGVIAKRRDAAYGVD